MKPTSEAQFAASEAWTTPALERVRDGLWVVGLPLDEPGVVQSTLTYLVEDSGGAVHAIDPGMDVPGNWDLLGAALAATGHSFDDVASATSTHLHPDHVGLSDRLHAASGATIVMHRIDAEALDGAAMAEFRAENVAKLAEWGVPADRAAAIAALPQHEMPRPQVGATLEDRQLLDIPGRTIEVLLTPGHTSGHATLRDETDGVMFTGDHILPTVFPGLGLGGRTASNPVGDYFAALDRVAAFDDYEALPGHGYRFTGLAGRCAEIREHSMVRSRQVAEVLATTTDPTIWEIASRISWTAGFENLPDRFLQLALAQTAMHVAYVRSL